MCGCNTRWYRATEKKLEQVNRAIAKSIKVNPRLRNKRRERLYADRARLQARQKNQRLTHHRQIASAIAKFADTVVVETPALWATLIRTRRERKTCPQAGRSR